MYQFIIFRESLLKQNERINALTKLKDTTNDAMENLTKTTKEASDNLEKSRTAFAKLGVENESMKATKSKVETAIKNEIKVHEELQRGLDKAKDHANKLKEQVNVFYLKIK